MPDTLEQTLAVVLRQVTKVDETLEKVGDQVGSLRTDISVLAAQMENDRERVDNGAKERVEIKHRQEDMERRMAGLDARLQALEGGFRTTNRILSWIGGVVAAAAFGLLWAVFTGQVLLVFN